VLLTNVPDPTTPLAGLAVADGEALEAAFDVAGGDADALSDGSDGEEAFVWVGAAEVSGVQPTMSAATRANRIPLV